MADFLTPTWDSLFKERNKGGEIMSDIKDLLDTIIQGDCLEIMKTMESNCIDLIITSPPYDNLRDYKGYIFNFEGIAKELYRITKNGGVVVWIVGDATIKGNETGTSFKQALYFKEIGFNLHDTMIWAHRTLPQNGNRYEPAFEYMFVLSKGVPKTFNPLKSKRKYNDTRTDKTFHRDKKGEFTHNVFHQQDEVVIGNVWEISNRGQDKIAYEHPAIFPEKLAENHILSWSNEGDIVLDPMAGSGTTLKMAKKNNRKYIGIEISFEYIDIINKRLNFEILDFREKDD